MRYLTLMRQAFADISADSFRAPLPPARRLHWLYFAAAAIAELFTPDVFAFASPIYSIFAAGCQPISRIFFFRLAAATPLRFQLLAFRFRRIYYASRHIATFQR